MKILIDIGHPAHVHYFRNFIRIMNVKHHQIFVVARSKDVTQELLSNYKIPFLGRGYGANTLIGKLLYFFKATHSILRQSLKFKPDLLLSVAPYTPLVSKILGIPSISVNDTEHAKFQNLFRNHISDCLLTPSCYINNLGRKQFRFNGYLELCSLHPNYYQPDPSVLDLLNIRNGEKFIVLRFVSWAASHDMGHSGVSIEMKRKIVAELRKYAKVFISSEGKLPEDLENYRIEISPEKMHDVLFYATLLLGESATMASECAVLGTPAIFIDDDGRGYTEEQEKQYGLVFNYSERSSDQEKALEKAIQLVNSSNIPAQWQKRRQRMLTDKIDVTAFMVWFIENYPKSAKIMRQDPDCQTKFL